MEEVKLPFNLTTGMPTKGNIPDTVDIEKQKADALAAQSKLAAEQTAKEKAEKDKADKAKKDTNKTDKSKVENEEDEVTESLLSDEEIQSKLDELSEIEEDKLSDEDKEFIQKYTQEDQSEIDTVKTTLEETYGIKVTNKYDNNIEGFKQLTNDIVPQIAENIFKEALEGVPFLKEFYEHITSGRTIDTFLAKNETPDFEKIVVKSYTDLEGSEKITAINSLKQLVKLDLTAKGNSPEDTQALIDLYEANGSLYERGKAAKDTLIKSHKANVQAKIEQEEKRIKKAEQDALAEIKELNTIIDKNNIVGLSIPDVDLKPFKEALFKPIDNKGNTKLDLMRDKLTLEQRGFIDYIIFKQFKLPTLKKVEENKSFTFSKKNKDNDKRVGSRFFGSEKRNEDKKTNSLNIDMKGIDYSQLMKATG